MSTTDHLWATEFQGLFLFKYSAIVLKYCTGFPVKDARFSKIKNILNLLCNDNEGEINENINFNYFSNRASLMGNPVVEVHIITKSPVH